MKIIQSSDNGDQYKNQSIVRQVDCYESFQSNETKYPEQTSLKNLPVFVK